MTREEDLIRIAKKLDKMVSRNNTEGAMDLLRELKGFNMTLRLLQETRIGMSVNGIRKHCTDEEVIALAKVLIKDWKRLLDSGHSHPEKPSEMNGLNSSKAAMSPNSSPSETQSSHRRLDVKPKQDSDPDKKHSSKNRKEKHHDENKSKKRHADDLSDEKHLEEPQNEKHPHEIRKEKHLEESKPAEDARLQVDNRKQKQDLQSEKHKPEPGKERPLEEPKKTRHVEEVKKEKHPEEPKKHSYADDVKKDKLREENRHERPINAVQRARPQSDPQREKPADVHKPIFERRGVLDSSILYPTRFPSPPRPARPLLPIKRPSLDLRKDRKEAPDPNAPLPPLPLHLHPPPPLKRPSLDGKKESRKEASDSKPPSQKKTSDHVKKDRSGMWELLWLSFILEKPLCCCLRRISDLRLKSPVVVCFRRNVDTELECSAVSRVVSVIHLFLFTRLQRK
ncbi:transcription elongation factor A protein 3 isoform X1 [Chelmon rostratus]|uniref:transcription elongation factor A protein 3 isoform X1 n=1 Tax=Chelmon rostratus TaxID=109905 RepID=UPI001BE5981A|nr:transcription elongation factor A protein 3 isoform X1 [Chelmon rostratus]